MNKRRRIKKPVLFDVVNITLLLLFGLTILYPFYNSIIISLATPAEYSRTPFMLFPKEVTFDAYTYVLSNNGLVNGFAATGFVLLFGVPINIMLTTFAAFVLSRKNFPAKRIFFFFIVFTMFFSGGLIPTYLVVRDLSLTNSLWSIILLQAMNTFYFILMKNYFSSIPDSMEESAKIDGANDITVLFRIIIPLSKPIIATILLFYTVDRWNEWFYSMLFIKSADIIPLQVMLRNIVFVSLYEIKDAAFDSIEVFFGEGIKMAAIVITMTPVMILYPFVQKYFVKGIMVGAIK